jgi:hypothetical protein
MIYIYMFKCLVMLTNYIIIIIIIIIPNVINLMNWRSWTRSGL